MKTVLFFVILSWLILAQVLGQCSDYQNGLACTLFQPAQTHFTTSIEAPPEPETVGFTLPSLEAPSYDVLPHETAPFESLPLRLWMLDVKLLLIVAAISYASLPWTKKGLDVFDVVLEGHVIIGTLLLLMGFIYKAVMMVSGAEDIS